LGQILTKLKNLDKTKVGKILASNTKNSSKNA
jgi:hypothetical protein